MSVKKAALSLLLIFGFIGLGFAQEDLTPMTLTEALNRAQTENLTLKAANQGLEAASARIGAGWNIDKTSVYYGYDKNDIAENGVYNRVWGASQRFGFPSLYAAQKKVFQDDALMMQSNVELKMRQVNADVSKAFVTSVFWRDLIKHYSFLDSLYGNFSNASTRRFETGESNYLEKLTASAKQREIGLKKDESSQQYQIALQQLKWLLNWEGDLTLANEMVDLSLISPSDWTAHPGVLYYENALLKAGHQVQVEKRKNLPDIQLDVFRGTNPGPEAKVYPGFQAGLAIPLFFGAQRSQAKAAEFGFQQIELEGAQYQNQLENRYQQLLRQLEQNQKVIAYYNEEGKTLSEQLMQQAQRSFQEGEIDFLQFVQLIENSRGITLQYMQSLHAYQLTILEINYLIN